MANGKGVVSLSGNGWVGPERRKERSLITEINLCSATGSSVLASAIA